MKLKANRSLIRKVGRDLFPTLEKTPATLKRCFDTSFEWSSLPRENASIR